MATAIEYGLIAALISVGLITQQQSLDEEFMREFLANYNAMCLLEGTHVATPDGEQPVESLAIGDPVLTPEGGVRPVRWIGRQTIVAAFADPLRSWPVCVAAGALGEGVPHRPLLLSPDHALLVDGLLVQAGALVNDTTITRVTDAPERFTYFHVELEDHALILAEGVPAETFVDNVTRRGFDNYAEYEARFGGDAAAIPEMPAPRIKSARQVPRSIRARLDARAARIGCLVAAVA
jgi:hypothetical protein